MRRVHRYYNRYPHGSLEGFAANYACRYVKRRILAVIVGIVILFICVVVFAGVLAFAHFWPDLDSYGTDTAGAAVVKANTAAAACTDNNFGTVSAASSGTVAGEVDSSGIAAGSAGSSGIAAGSAGSSGLKSAETTDLDTDPGKNDFDAGNLIVKKDMGDEIGMINASSRWQKFHVNVGGDYSNLATFRISVPGTGYLIMEIDTKGKQIMNNIVVIKADGFEGIEYMTPDNKKTYIGVSKGIYTISARSYKSEYDMNLKFKKVKEGKFGTTKSKAPVMKKYWSRKGIITTDKHQTHWYKIKHTNTKPIRIKARTLNSSGGHGGIQVSLYQGNRLRGSDFTIRSNDSINFKVPPYRNARYLEKGTYYIKVESHFGGNGYYSIKWK